MEGKGGYKVSLSLEWWDSGAGNWGCGVRVGTVITVIRGGNLHVDRGSQRLRLLIS